MSSTKYPCYSLESPVNMFILSSERIRHNTKYIDMQRSKSLHFVLLMGENYKYLVELSLIKVFCNVRFASFSKLSV